MYVIEWTDPDDNVNDMPHTVRRPAPSEAGEYVLLLLRTGSTHIEITKEA